MPKKPLMADGCSEYTMYNLRIFMPKGNESCQYCPCLKFDHDSDTRRCKFTWEFIPNPKSTVGYYCPLEIMAENKEDKQC